MKIPVSRVDLNNLVNTLLNNEGFFVDNKNLHFCGDFASSFFTNQSLLVHDIINGSISIEMWNSRFVLLL